jgi:histidine ammonia-lyase
MIKVDGNSLLLQDIISVSRNYERVELTDDAQTNIKNSHEKLNRILERDKPVYGINTGFGIFSEKTINKKDTRLLSRKLIVSHAVGTGDPLPDDVVRAAILIRANTLAKGYSGVRLELVNTLLKMLNADIYPIIPSQGSLGSSGDLCQLSHMALVLSKSDNDDDNESGLAKYKNEVMSGKAAMEKAGIPRIILGAKEGLGLNNGATFSTAIGALAVSDSNYLVHVANLAVSLSLEALMGCSAAFRKEIHLLRSHPGQQNVAKEISTLISESELVDQGKRVQDAYSLRCSPQVHGAVWDTVQFCQSIIDREINSATDNPLIFGDELVLSGGNFHGEPIGFAMDFLGIAMSELGAISERRIFRLIDGALNAGLPPMLVGKPELAGINSGVMMLQYTAASLVLENQTLATPDSVHSLPTSSNQEDHNANSMTAARHASMIIENVTHILATELFTAIRAIHIRLENQSTKLGKGTSKAYDEISRVVEFHPEDRYWLAGIDKIKALIRDQRLSIAN